MAGSEAAGHGAWAESVARAHLTEAGLKEIDRNHREKCGEIDIVMTDRKALIFVEVRYRRNDRWGGALASVTWRKRQRLIRTAGVYLRRHPHLARFPCRFDVVGVGGTPEDPEIRWVKNAFEG